MEFLYKVTKSTEIERGGERERGGQKKEQRENEANMFTNDERREGVENEYARRCKWCRRVPEVPFLRFHRCSQTACTEQPVSRRYPKLN